jgi:hypothetical protein
MATVDVIRELDDEHLEGPRPGRPLPHAETPRATGELDQHHLR